MWQKVTVKIYKPSHRQDEFTQLTQSEREAAWQRGREIFKSSQDRQLKDNRAFVRYGVDGERVTCLGELAALAVAKLLGLEWTNSLDTFKGPDLAGNIEVRLIGHEHYGLRVYGNDDDSRRVVGCVIEKGNEEGRYRIPGWINAKYGKEEAWLHDPLGRGHPVYIVPQSQLESLDSLRQLLKT